MKQTKTLKIKSKVKFNKWSAVAIGSVITGIGVYMLFFASAATNNCSNLYSAAQIKNGGSAPPEAQICDMNQATNPAGNDSVASVDGEVQNLVSQGWTDWGVAFRAPTTSVNGAIGVHRFNDKRLGAHIFITVTDPLFNQFRADPNNYVDEGLRFYAWPDTRQPGTEGVYRVTRKAPHLLQLYSTNLQWVNHFVSNTDGTWDNGGIAFYAYPANYFPPVPSTTPAKNDNCPNQNLKPGDKGACVKSHKAALNVLGAKLDANNDTFDTVTNDNTRLFVTALKQRGATVSAYGNIVTKEIWDAIAKGYPVAAPTTPSSATPATPGSAPPARTNTPTNPANPPGSSAPVVVLTGEPAPSTCSKSAKEYQQVITDGKAGTLTQDCHKWWLTAIKNSNDATAKEAVRGAQDAVTASAEGIRAANARIIAAISRGVGASEEAKRACDMNGMRNLVGKMNENREASWRLASRLTAITIQDVNDATTQVKNDAIAINRDYAEVKALVFEANGYITRVDCIAAKAIVSEGYARVRNLTGQIKKVVDGLLMLAKGQQVKTPVGQTYELSSPILFHDADGSIIGKKKSSGAGGITRKSQRITFVW